MIYRLLLQHILHCITPSRKHCQHMASVVTLNKSVWFNCGRLSVRTTRWALQTFSPTWGRPSAAVFLSVRSDLNCSHSCGTVGRFTQTRLSYYVAIISKKGRASFQNQGFVMEREASDTHGCPLHTALFAEAEPDSTVFVFSRTHCLFLLTMCHGGVMKMDDTLLGLSPAVLCSLRVSSSTWPSWSDAQEAACASCLPQTGSALFFSANISSLCLQAPTAPCYSERDAWKYTHICLIWCNGISFTHRGCSGPLLFSHFALLHPFCSEKDLPLSMNVCIKTLQWELGCPVMSNSVFA